MSKLIYCYDEETKQYLLSKQYPLLKEDKEQGIFIFINNKPMSDFGSMANKVRFSNQMTF